MIRMEHVTKVYGEDKNSVVALKEVSLSISEGEFVSIIGPSGSGKSTFLLTVSGLTTPTQGKVYIDGRSIYDLSAVERAKLRRSTLGFMFQTFNLIPYLTALENVQVPLCIAGKSGGEQRRIATELLERVGLGGRLSHKPGELSVGERQRVALARTLANGPSIILADEPTGNLDPHHSREVFEYLERFHQEGITVVVVTHDQDAARYSSRRLRIVEGRIEEDTRGDEIAAEI